MVSGKTGLEQVTVEGFLVPPTLHPGAPQCARRGLQQMEVRALWMICTIRDSNGVGKGIKRGPQIAVVGMVVVCMQRGSEGICWGPKEEQGFLTATFLPKLEEPCELLGHAAWAGAASFMSSDHSSLFDTRLQVTHLSLPLCLCSTLPYPVLA